MLMLLVYDSSNGKLVGNGMSGSYYKPQGELKYIEAEIPDGRYPIKVDVTKTPHTVVLSEPPMDPIAEKLAEIEKRLANVEDDNIKVLAAMAETYETVLPFLPPQN